MAKCCVCDKATSGSLEFCSKHYTEHKADILGKKDWVRAMKNSMQRERRQREREFDNVSLDEFLEPKPYRRDY